MLINCDLHETLGNESTSDHSLPIEPYILYSYTQVEPADLLLVQFSSSRYPVSYTWSAESGEGALPRKSSKGLHNVCSSSFEYRKRVTAEEAYPHKKVGFVLNATGVRFGQLN